VAGWAPVRLLFIHGPYPVRSKHVGYANALVRGPRVQGPGCLVSWAGRANRRTDDVPAAVILSLEEVCSYTATLAYMTSTSDLGWNATTMPMTN
jgi:hypothetical protein